MTSLEIMDVHILHGYTQLTKVFSLHCRRQILSIHCLTLQYCYSSSHFSMVAKEVKLVALVEGIRIHQYIDNWHEKQSHSSDKETPTGWFILLKAWVGSYLWKVRFDPNSRNQIFGFNLLIRPQGRASLPNSKEIDHLLKKTCTMLKAFTHLQGSSCHFESRVSMEKTIPLGGLHLKSFQWYLKAHCRYPQSLDIPLLVSLVRRDHLQWWTNLSILKEDSPLLQKKHYLLPFTDASLKGWSSHLKHRTASGLWNQDGSRLHVTF